MTTESHFDDGRPVGNMPVEGEATSEREVTLVDCPIGLFWSDETLALKTEYGNNEGRINAYIVGSGEFFWGDALQTIASQRATKVIPIDSDHAEQALSPTAEMRIEEDDGVLAQIKAPPNNEPDPAWKAIKRGIDQFVGRMPTISKHRATNNAHLKAIVERLDASGDREAADTIVWQAWFRALDAERTRFLLDDMREQLAAKAS